MHICREATTASLMKTGGSRAGPPAVSATRLVLNTASGELRLIPRRRQAGVDRVTGDRRAADSGWEISGGGGGWEREREREREREQGRSVTTPPPSTQQMQQAVWNAANSAVPTDALCQRRRGRTPIGPQCHWPTDDVHS